MKLKLEIFQKLTQLYCVFLFFTFCFNTKVINTKRKRIFLLYFMKQIVNFVLNLLNWRIWDTTKSKLKRKVNKNYAEWRRMVDSQFNWMKIFMYFFFVLFVCCCKKWCHETWIILKRVMWTNFHFIIFFIENLLSFSIIQWS